jgi:hypothetical protein
MTHSAVTPENHAHCMQSALCSGFCGAVILRKALLTATVLAEPGDSPNILIPNAIAKIIEAGRYCYIETLVGRRLIVAQGCSDAGFPIESEALVKP